MNALEQTNPEACLWVDASRCIGCQSCEVACKLEHELPAGPRPIKVIQVGPLQQGEELVMFFQPATCMHCTYPACVMACPTGAMQKRGNEFVSSDPEVCIGCQTCAIACPFGIPQLHTGIGRISKCDGCAARTEKNLSPACMLACPTGALAFVSPIQKTQAVRQQAAALVRQARPFKQIRS